MGITMFDCRYQTVPDWNNPLLRNPFWRCYLPITTGASLRFKEKLLPLVANQGTIIPPETPVRGRADGPFSIYYAHFHCTLHASEPVPRSFPVTASIRHALDLATGNRAPAPFNSAMLELIAAGMAAIPHEELAPAITDNRIVRARSIMARSLDTRIANKELATHLNMSETALLRLFRETLGTSPQKEHLRLRLNHAANLLLQSEESIDQIAERCGFCDRNHFTRTFTREWEITPAHYRRTATPL